MTPLAHALAYARFGFPVLPLAPRAKTPIVPHGVKDATTNRIQIERWFTGTPDANVGIAVVDPLRVLDIDPRNGGAVELRQLVAEYGALPRTKAQRTGSGGGHFLFLVPKGTTTRTKIGPGVEILGPGKYFVAAPSIHPCGGVYAWRSPTGTPIALMPAWLLGLASRSAVEEQPTAPIAPSSPDAFARAKAYVAKVAPAISGSGGHAHTFVLAQRLVRGFALSDGEALALLREWNRACSPPWSEADLRRKVVEARARGEMPRGALLEGRRAS